ncbi:holo-ACP synthase [Streptomyces sp. NPDC001719]
MNAAAIPAETDGTEAAETAETFGLGIDVLDRDELRRLLTRPWFLRFVFAPEELAAAGSMGEERRLEFLAGRFAAKEAVLKALGTGMLQGIAPREICVERAADGSPRVSLRGRAACPGRPAVTVSITHKHDVVAAVAIVRPSPTTPTTRGDPDDAAARR